VSPAPGWLDGLALAFVLAGFASAALIAVDLIRRPQKMAIMNWVWPITGLYGGPLALLAYSLFGRRPRGGAGTPEKPRWATPLIGALHCGAGCALGDLAAEWVVFAAGFVLFRSKLAATWSTDFAFAYLLGIVFQYFSIAPMRGLGPVAGLKAAVMADTLSLVAYEIGMFAWMAVVKLLLFPGLEPTRWLFWWMMQVAMLVGLATTYPVNAWLIRKGLKEAM
jgi:hypothetical protein